MPWDKPLEQGMAMNWKTAYRSFYYAAAPEPDDMVLEPAETAVLVIDIQNTYLEVPEDPAEAARWQPFFERMNATVIPNTAALVEACRPAPGHQGHVAGLQVVEIHHSIISTLLGINHRGIG